MMAARSNRGFTLVELMVGLAIASATMLGTVRLYIHAAAEFRAAQSELFIEESAHLAITALRTDIERAGSFGLLAADDPLALGLEDPDIAVRGDCGEDWSTRIQEPVAAVNNTYAWTCSAYADAAASGSDTLVLRYAGPFSPESPEAGRVYIRTSANERAQLFVAPRGSFIADQSLAVTHLLRARGYYVSSSSAADTQQSPVPALRVKQLTRRGGRPSVIDEEIQSGVEDLQVELIMDAAEFDASASPEHRRVRAVRIWLLVRSSLREANTVSSIAAYADRSSRVFSDGLRRRLFQYTIAVRHEPLR